MRAPHEMVSTSDSGRVPWLRPVAVTTLGCMGALGVALLIAWVAWSFTKVHAALFDENHVWWILGASMVFVVGVSSAWTGLRGTPDPKLVQDALDGKAPVDGKRNAFIGTIRSGVRPLAAPVTGTPSALYDYEIAIPSSAEVTTGAVVYTGKHMSSPVIETGHATVRLQGLPRLVGFSHETTTEPETIERFVDSTRFERIEQKEALRQKFGDYFDEDGLIAKDHQLEERPASFIGSTLETKLVADGAQAGIIGTWDRKTGTVGAGEITTLYDTSNETNLRLMKGGGTGCGCVFGPLLMTAALLVLVGPLVPAEVLARLSFVSEPLLEARAKRVSSYIEDGDLHAARRLAGLGLGGATVDALPRLTGDLVLVELLLANGADPDTRDVWGDTLLMKARDSLMVERLLLYGASRSMRNEEGGTAGEAAVASRNFAVAARLLEPAGVGEPLGLAIRKGDDDELARHLSSGIDPNAPILLLDAEVSLLYYASVLRNRVAVERLLEAGASFQTEPSPLQGAVEARSPGILSLLVSEGGDAVFDEDARWELLDLGISLGSVEIVERLISLGAEPDPYLLEKVDDPAMREALRDSHR